MIPAVLVGACAHSLAILRSLARAGVDVHVLEANRNLPGLRSSYGHTHLTEDVNGDGLVPALVALREKVSSSERPVLFLTNDRMISSVGAQIDLIIPHYRLSWSTTPAEIVQLTTKSAIGQRCISAGLHYPRSWMLSNLRTIDRIAEQLTWPAIVKPDLPLSGFKVRVVRSIGELREFVREHAEDFPVLVQEWIPGDDDCIFFSAAYLDRGNVMARFEGHKLRAFPMGHTTVAEPYVHDQAYDCMRRFFSGLELSGPVSLELKLGHDGRLWVIEPTVGRTDFWVDLCVSNGVDLPLIQYRSQIGKSVPSGVQCNSSIWINAERDTFAFAWYLIHLGRAAKLLRSIRFTYFDWSDVRPFCKAIARDSVRYYVAVRKRIKRLILGSDSATRDMP